MFVLNDSICRVARPAEFSNLVRCRKRRRMSVKMTVFLIRRTRARGTPAPPDDMKIPRCLEDRRDGRDEKGHFIDPSGNIPVQNHATTALQAGFAHRREIHRTIRSSAGKQSALSSYVRTIRERAGCSRTWGRPADVIWNMTLLSPVPGLSKRLSSFPSMARDQKSKIFRIQLKCLSGHPHAYIYNMCELSCFYNK